MPYRGKFGLLPLDGVKIKVSVSTNAIRLLIIVPGKILIRRRVLTVPDVHLASFLQRRNYSLERAKQTLDEYLTFVTLVPEILHKAHQKSQVLEICFESQ